MIFIHDLPVLLQHVKALPPPENTYSLVMSWQVIAVANDGSLWRLLSFGGYEQNSSLDNEKCHCLV